ncbi:MAG TPA: DUF805 domain-containing protein [Rhodocyclaceae bacterium]|nr:DUF805 domain-containing protein [Rhodocyclaceae bacterium]
MTFTESIKTCFSKYADFNGRASLSEYWWFVLFFFLGSLTAAVSPTLAALFYLAILFPSFAVATRRLHYTDRSGWWQLLALLFPIGGFVLLYFFSQPGKEPNRYGDSPLLRLE